MVGSNPSISIIIPAYNVEKYLKAALESIRLQSVLPDEVILINDGSSDDTLNVAKAFNLPVPYKVISVENKGQGNARNLGIHLASSEYVYFFDSDDLLTKDFIRTLKEHIHRNQRPDMILFSGESFNDDEYQGDRWINYSRSFSGVFNNRTDFLNQARSHKALFCSPCLYVSKKSLWGRNKLEFGPYFLEDEAIFFPVIFACSTFLVVDEILFLRRNREGSTMTVDLESKHLSGALYCMQSSLTLYKASKWARSESWHIRKQIEKHCVFYIRMARVPKFNVKKIEVLRAVLLSRSITLILKVVLFSFRVDQSDTIRKMGNFIKILES